jgi:hypothetical protein
MDGALVERERAFDHLLDAAGDAVAGCGPSVSRVFSTIRSSVP